MVKGFNFALIEVQDDALLLVYWDHTAAKIASSLTTSSPAAFSIWAMMADGPAALLHFISLSALQIWVGRRHKGRRAGSWSSLLGHLNSTLRSLTPCSKPFHYIVFISERKLVGIIQYTVLANGLCGPSVWRHVKHHHHHGILWRISLSLSPTLYAWPRTWRHCLLGLRCLVALVRGLVGFEPCMLL